MTNLIRFDWAIKYLLRNKANFDILEGFLSELLKRDIRIESILESESNKTEAEGKFNRVDLLVEADGKEQIIIEVQCSRQWDYYSRMLYATSKTVTEHLKAGMGYGHIKRIISVNVVFFNLGSGKDYLYRGTTRFEGMHYHDVLSLDPQEKEAYMKTAIQAETPADIFPEYYLIKVDQFHERIKDKFDEWVYFLKNSAIQPNFHAQGIQEAAHKLNVLQLSEGDRRAYDRFQEELMYEVSMTDVPFELGHDEGLKQGREEGMKEGLEQGARQVKEALAKTLLQEGLDVSRVAKLVGLEPEIVSKMQKTES